MSINSSSSWRNVYGSFWSEKNVFAKNGNFVFGDKKVTFESSGLSSSLDYTNIQSIGIKNYLMSQHIAIEVTDKLIYFLMPNPKFYIKKIIELSDKSIPLFKHKPSFLRKLFYIFYYLNFLITLFLILFKGTFFWTADFWVKYLVAQVLVLTFISLGLTIYLRRIQPQRSWIPLRQLTLVIWAIPLLGNLFALTYINLFYFKWPKLKVTPTKPMN